MMNTVAPVWDGNETAGTGGGGLLACACLLCAHACTLYAGYCYAVGAIFRGVAFEYRFKLASKRVLGFIFIIGSLIAAESGHYAGRNATGY